MRARLKTLTAVAVASAILGVHPPAALAGPMDDRGEPPVTNEGETLYGDIWNEANTLNSGSSEYGGEPPPPCTWTDNSDPDNPVERRDGTPQWSLTRLGNDTWSPILDGSPDEGIVYRYECWHDDMEGEDCQTEDGETQCFGEPIYDTWCDDFVCYFENINPANLALIAVDGFIRDLPAAEPQFNPPNETTLVNFNTWMWVDNVPGGGVINPPDMSVPGITVETEAELTELHWDMGDGSPGKRCPLVTSESEASDSCTYAYDRSSAGEPDDEFQGSVDITWTATWTLLETGLSADIDVPLTTDFALAVAESQAIVTED